MTNKRYDGGFRELNKPVSVSNIGWFVTVTNSTAVDGWYLHSDLELYRKTGDSTTGVYSGYFATLDKANEARDNYYTKYNTLVINPYNKKAFDRAMKGI